MNLKLENAVKLLTVLAALITAVSELLRQFNDTTDKVRSTMGNIGNKGQK
jgi:hypothetical protein